MITQAELRAYCTPYSDHPVMPATRLRLGFAIVQAECSLVVVDVVTGKHPRLLTTNLDDAQEPLRALSVINVERPTARHRPRHGWLRRLRRALR